MTVRVVAQDPLIPPPDPDNLHLSLRDSRMITAEIGDAISLAFYNLSQHNAMLYDYWLSELYNEEGEMILEQWNQSNLKLMEKDVMNQIQAVDDF